MKEGPGQPDYEFESHDFIFPVDHNLALALSRLYLWVAANQTENTEIEKYASISNSYNVIADKTVHPAVSSTYTREVSDPAQLESFIQDFYNDFKERVNASVFRNVLDTPAEIEDIPNPFDPTSVELDALTGLQTKIGVFRYRHGDSNSF